MIRRASSSKFSSEQWRTIRLTNHPQTGHRSAACCVRPRSAANGRSGQADLWPNDKKLDRTRLPTKYFKAGDGRYEKRAARGRI